MIVYFLTVRSVTYAQRGQAVLARHGIHSRLRRTPRWMEQQGCGYCLELRPGDVQEAISLLKQEQIPVKRLYVQRGNEKPEVAAQL